MSRVAWPCLCGFDGTKNQIQYHQRTCKVWQERDVAAVRRARRNQTTGAFSKPLPTGPRCSHCQAAPSHHRPGCPAKGPRKRRGLQFASVEVWLAFLRVLKKHYEETGRGAQLMDLFD